MPSPDALRWAAARLRNEADRLVPLLDGFIGALGPEVWSGPAADRVRSDLEVERRSLAEAALEIEGLAHTLAARADALALGGGDS